MISKKTVALLALSWAAGSGIGSLLGSIAVASIWGGSFGLVMKDWKRGLVLAISAIAAAEIVQYLVRSVAAPVFAKASPLLVGSGEGPSAVKFTLLVASILTLVIGLLAWKLARLFRLSRKLGLVISAVVGLWWIIISTPAMATISLRDMSELVRFFSVPVFYFTIGTFSGAILGATVGFALWSFRKVLALTMGGAIGSYIGTSVIFSAISLAVAGSDVYFQYFSSLTPIRSVGAALNGALFGALVGLSLKVEPVRNLSRRIKPETPISVSELGADE